MYEQRTYSQPLDYDIGVEANYESRKDSLAEKPNSKQADMPGEQPCIRAEDRHPPLACGIGVEHRRYSLEIAAKPSRKTKQQKGSPGVFRRCTVRRNLVGLRLLHPFCT